MIDQKILLFADGWLGRAAADALIEANVARVYCAKTVDDSVVGFTSLWSGEPVDVIISAGWRRKLTADELAIAPRAINLHPSPLPRYRGAAPLMRQLEAGETHTALTIHRISDGEGFDTGEILLQRFLPLLRPGDGPFWAGRPLDRVGQPFRRILPGALRCALDALDLSAPQRKDI